MKLFKQRMTKLTKLFMCVAFALALLAGAYGLLQEVQATTAMPDYAIVLPGDDDLQVAAPLAGRAAPYGQWIITHNSVADITTTMNYGTVARTNGYDAVKRVICYNSGSYSATLSIYLRTTSTGSLYPLDLSHDTILPGVRQVTDITDIAPWMTIGITSTNATTGTTMLCGIYVQTP